MIYRLPRNDLSLIPKSERVQEKASVEFVQQQILNKPKSVKWPNMDE